MARHRPRGDHHDRRGAPAGPAVPARDRRPDGCTTCSPTRAAPRLSRAPQPRSTPSCCGWPATTGPRAGSATADRRAAASVPTAGPAGRAVSGRRAAAEVVEQLDRAGLLPAIVFIFSRVGCDAAVQQCLERQPAADHARGARRDLRLRRGALLATCPTRTCAGPRLPRVPRRPDPRRRRSPRRACCRPSRSASRSCSCAGCAAWCSRPRRSRSVSTCRPARW